MEVQRGIVVIEEGAFKLASAWEVHRRMNILAGIPKKSVGLPAGQAGGSFPGRKNSICKGRNEQGSLTIQRTWTVFLE
jgi:hypothetical protein